MGNSYLTFMFAALGIASLQAATPEPDYSYMAIMVAPRAELVRPNHVPVAPPQTLALRLQLS